MEAAVLKAFRSLNVDEAMAIEAADALSRQADERYDQLGVRIDRLESKLGDRIDKLGERVEVVTRDLLVVKATQAVLVAMMLAVFVGSFVR
jgi:hypothetical protein